MPPPNQSALSGDDVKTFMSMDKGSQDKFIDSLSSDEQQQLLDGINQYGKQPDAPTAPAKDAYGFPQGAMPQPLKGFWDAAASRAVESGKGLARTFTAPPSTTAEKLAGPALPVMRMGEGLIGAEHEAGKQVGEQLKQSYQDFKAGDIVGGPAHAARAAVTTASMLDPFATGTVTDVNRLEDQGRNREAIGDAAFDTLTMLVGGKDKAELTTQKRSMLLSGATGGDVIKFGQVMNDLSETARTTGKVTTVGGLEENLYKTGERLETQFNVAKWPVRSKQVIPNEITTRLDKIVSDHPNWAQSAQGRKMIQGIKKVKTLYSKPWTIDQLNAERMDEGAGLRSFYGKDAGARMGAERTDIDMAISKAVRDGAAETVYGEVGRANPGLDVQLLKQKQSAILELREQLGGKVDELANKQAKAQTTTLREKATPHSYVSPHRIGVYVGGLRPDVPSLDVANAKVGNAFGATSKTGKVAGATRRAVLALPISRLVEGQSQKKGGLPPPPKPGGDPLTQFYNTDPAGEYLKSHPHATYTELADQFPKEVTRAEIPVGKTYEAVDDAAASMLREGGKDFFEQKLPFRAKVLVKWPGGDSMEDEIKGLNAGHAMWRAVRNWVGATVTYLGPGGSQ